MDRHIIHTIYKNFLHELNEASGGKQNSIAFIKNTLAQQPLVKENSLFQVMVIGGTVFRSAIVKKNGKKLEIVRTQTSSAPFFLTKDSFLSFIEKHLEHTISILALNFAYPMVPVFEDGKLDGVMLGNSGKSTFEGLIGKKVCKQIELYIAKTRGQKLIVSSANDTICLLLSGFINYSWDKVAAGIVGTGENLAIALDSITLVNLESANFDKFPLSAAGKEIDRHSPNPGKYLFEKETAGGFLYKHFNYSVDKGIITHRYVKNTEELNILAEKNLPASLYARELIKTSATLLSTEIAGILSFLKRDTVFIMQGSVFWKGYHYRQTVETLVHELEPTYKASFIHVEDSDILGAAKLVV